MRFLLNFEKTDYSRDPRTSTELVLTSLGIDIPEIQLTCRESIQRKHFVFELRLDRIKWRYSFPRRDSKNTIHWFHFTFTRRYVIAVVRRLLDMSRKLVEWLLKNDQRFKIRDVLTCSPQTHSDTYCVQAQNRRVGAFKISTRIECRLRRDVANAYSERRRLRSDEQWKKSIHDRQ